MKGAYCLVILVLKDIEIRVGSLGKIRFDKGKYVYVGSALNNLEKRVERHLTEGKKIFWHIDYLLSNPNTKIEEVYYKKSGEKKECKIANKVKNNGDPIKDFGSSDCKCESHLFKVKDVDFLEKFLKKFI